MNAHQSVGESQNLDKMAATLETLVARFKLA